MILLRRLDGCHCHDVCCKTIHAHRLPDWQISLTILFPTALILFWRILALPLNSCKKRIRMQKAVSYLLYADTPVNLIAEQLGYSCSENFMKVFKQEYGLTPTQYRARMKPQ